MKFKLILLLLFTQHLFSQVYVNDAKAYYNKSFSEFSNERSFCDLTIFPNSTFSFYSRPNYSCFTWKEIKGTWKKKKNIYTFSSQYEVVENDVRFNFDRDSLKEFILKFKTDKNSELKNRIIKINYVYDFDSGIQDFEKLMNLDKTNNVQIPFSDIPNIEKLASLRIEYQLSSSEKRFGYATESKTVNVKEREIPNIIFIEFVENPIRETVYRTTVGKLNGERLEIISSTKTKPKLPEYLNEVGFEKYYMLRK